jgi:3-oxoacyl-[acyl-carrier protein] reductase
MVEPESGVALVTGSTRGLGRTIAQRLAADGWTVAVNGPPGDPDLGPDAFAADVTSPSDVPAIVSAIEAALGPIEILVLNATGPQPDIALLDAAWSDHLDQLDFFVKSPLLLGRAIVPGMKQRGHGRIIHIDSEVADRPPPGRSAYSTAKAAQVGLAQAWARELAPHGITVNTVAPGFIPVERHAGVSAEIKDAYFATIPAARWGTPEDIANAVAFFASPTTSFITGQRLLVDGGRHLLP